MKTLDTRDLYKRKCELEELKEAIETAKEELDEANEALEEHESNPPEQGLEREPVWDLKWDQELEQLKEVVAQAERDLAGYESDFGEDEKQELAELEELESEVSDFRHGETMIPTHSFKEYAQQFADDIGAINRDATWPCNCIDWDQAAEELAMDYSEVTYQGESYYVRS